MAPHGLTTAADPRQQGHPMVVLTGPSAGVRARALEAALRDWRAAGLVVLDAVTPAPPFDVGPAAVYDALAALTLPRESLRPGPEGRGPAGAGLPARPDPAVWAQVVRRVTGDLPMVLAVRGADLAQDDVAAFFESLAHALAARGPARVVVDPMGGPGVRGLVHVVDDEAQRPGPAAATSGVDAQAGAGVVDPAGTPGPAVQAWRRGRPAKVRRPTAGHGGPDRRRPRLVLAEAGSVGRADGEGVIEAASEAVRAADRRRGAWACLAAVVLVRRCRPDLAGRWLRHADEAGYDGALAEYAAAQLRVLETVPVPALGYQAGGLGPEPWVLSQLTGVFATYRRVQFEVEQDGTRTRSSARDPEGLRGTLDAARRARAVLLWCRAARTARDVGLAPGPVPMCPDGTDDLGPALLSLLAAGWSTADCAALLALSRRAVEKRLTGLYRASGTSSRTALVSAHLSGALHWGPDGPRR